MILTYSYMRVVEMMAVEKKNYPSLHSFKCQIISVLKIGARHFGRHKVCVCVYYVWGR